MENNLLLQELSYWQWEISGYRKAALIIEDRLCTMQKHVEPGNATRSQIRRLLDRFVAEDLELCELEKDIVSEKEAIRRLKLNEESLKTIIPAHEQTVKRISEEEKLFPALKHDYDQLIDELLLQLYATPPNRQ